MENIDVVTLLVQLISGAVGGIIVGALLGGLSLGLVGNALAGLIGGGVGGQLLTTILNLPPAALATGDFDPITVGGQVASGAAGGAVLMLVVGILRIIFAK